MTAELDGATGPLGQLSGSARLASELLACGFRDIQMVPGAPATDVIDELDRLVKDGEIGEDEGRRAEKELEDLTHRFVTAVDEVLKHKEAELLEV